MRTLAALVMGITIALPVIASAVNPSSPVPKVNGTAMTADRNGQVHVSECKRIAKQIIQFEKVKGMAEERRDEPWANATQTHIARLEGQWNARCYNGVDEWQVAFNELVRGASEAAIRYFTFGGF
jgi:hypothetical protein